MLVLPFLERMVRSLVRVGRPEAAWPMAREAADRTGEPWLALIVLASRGDVEGTLALLDSFAAVGYGVREFYEDEDLAAALRTEALAPARRRYPLPE